MPSFSIIFVVGNRRSDVARRAAFGSRATIVWPASESARTSTDVLPAASRENVSRLTSTPAFSAFLPMSEKRFVAMQSACVAPGPRIATALAIASALQVCVPSCSLLAPMPGPMIAK